MTQNERRNMSRLRFLGLARYTEPHSGKWFITRRGYAFLRGEEVPREVWIYRNKINEELRTDKTTTLTQVFKADVPYFEAVQEIQTTIATPAHQRVAVERNENQASLL